jgi:hypothetical protein
MHVTAIKQKKRHSDRSAISLSLMKGVFDDAAVFLLMRRRIAGRTSAYGHD